MTRKLLIIFILSLLLTPNSFSAGSSGSSSGGDNSSTKSDYDKAVKLHQNVAYITMFSLALSGVLTILPY